jgi:hypothetical protein
MGGIAAPSGCRMTGVPPWFLLSRNSPAPTYQHHADDPLPADFSGGTDRVRRPTVLDFEPVGECCRSCILPIRGFANYP